MQLTQVSLAPRKHHLFSTQCSEYIKSASSAPTVPIPSTFLALNFFRSPLTLYTPPSLTSISFPYQSPVSHFPEFLFQLCLIPLILSPYLLPNSILSTCSNPNMALKGPQAPILLVRFLSYTYSIPFPYIYTLFLLPSHSVQDSFKKPKYEGKLPQDKTQRTVERLREIKLDKKKLFNLKIPE